VRGGGNRRKKKSPPSHMRTKAEGGFQSQENQSRGGGPNERGQRHEKLGTEHQGGSELERTGRRYKGLPTRRLPLKGATQGGKRRRRGLRATGGGVPRASRGAGTQRPKRENSSPAQRFCWREKRTAALTAGQGKEK